MKKNILAAILGATVLFAVNTQATPIDLGQAPGSPANLSSVLGRLNTAITAYNALYNPDLAAAVLAGAVANTSSGVTTININITGWSYIALKWADTDQFYYVGADTGTLTFNSTVFNQNSQAQCLSGYSLFNPGVTNHTVPDGGSTALLLGSALSSLSLVARRLKK
jgi:hypothetical protein